MLRKLAFFTALVVVLNIVSQKYKVQYGRVWRAVRDVSFCCCHRARTMKDRRWIIEILYVNHCSGINSLQQKCSIHNEIGFIHLYKSSEFNCLTLVAFIVTNNSMTLSAEKLFYWNPPICLIFDIIHFLYSWSLMFKAVSLKYLQCRKKCFDKWAQRAHICLLMKCLQGISAFEKILSFHVLKRLWTPHSCISMSLFSSKWNVCHFFYQHPNSVYWKGINNTYNQKQKLNHEKSLIIMFHIFLSRWDVFCRKMRSEGYNGHRVLIFGVMDKWAVCSLLI